VIDFSPWGYDERQFNSPGIALNVGRLTRAAEGGYPEYHTSADNLDLVTPAALAEAFRTFCEVIDVLERDARYRTLQGHCEPQLGKYGLYDDLGGASSVEAAKLALLWVLNQSDGSQSLLDIAERSGLQFVDVHFAATRLERAGLLERVAAH
jgi:aminopeptidase-like protein